jgi:hypothetical protein
MQISYTNIGTAVTLDDFTMKMQLLGSFIFLWTDMYTWYRFSLQCYDISCIDMQVLEAWEHTRVLPDAWMKGARRTRRTWTLPVREEICMVGLYWFWTACKVTSQILILDYSHIDSLGINCWTVYVCCDFRMVNLLWFPFLSKMYCFDIHTKFWNCHGYCWLESICLDASVLIRDIVWTAVPCMMYLRFLFFMDLHFRSEWVSVFRRSRYCADGIMRCVWALSF